MPDSISRMAGRYISELRRVQPSGPYRLAGWSAGGTIALEMAMQLTEAGHPVAFLGLIDTRRDYAGAFPSASGEGDILSTPVFDDVEALAALAGSPTAFEGDLSGLDFDTLLLRLRAAGAAVPELDTPTLRRHLAFRHHMRLALRRFPVPASAPVPISLFVAKDHPRTDATLGWSDLAEAGQVEIVPLAGDHHSLVAEPHVGALAKAISERLECGTPGRPAKPDMTTHSNPHPVLH
jgi:thioesterase domain-containing protein